MSDAKTEQLKLLRAPFPDHQISKLPKETKKQREEREADMNKGVKCQLCGGWHHKNAVHVDYVGHAAATDRLLDVDIGWDWEPLTTDAAGLPMFDKTGGLWIKLTVAGKTRLGYGNAEGKSGGDAVKEIIGDAIRNAGMRFGMALDLWHKGDLHLAEEAEPEAPVVPASVRYLTDLQASVDAIDSLDGLSAYFKSSQAEMNAMLEGDDLKRANGIFNKRKAALTPAQKDAA